MRRIAIFRALQLGDILCAMPAVKSIKDYYKDTELIFIGLPHTRKIIEYFSGTIDSFVDFPGYPGLPEQQFDETNFNHFLQQMRNLEIDILFQIHGKGSVVYDFLKQCNIRRIVGFCETDSGQNQNMLLYPDHLHEIDRHLALLKYLGIPCNNASMFLPIGAEERKAFREMNTGLAAKRYICIHPGSRAKWRQWPPFYFAALADYCKEEGFEVAITGSVDEIDIANEVLAKMKYKPVFLVGKTSLGTISCLIENAFGLIANCTGVSHIAAALKTPSVIISMDGEPQRWGPKNKELHTTLDWTVNSDYSFVQAAVKNMLKSTVSSINLK